MISGSPPNRRCHSPWLKTTTGFAPGLSSSFVKTRPRGFDSARQTDLPTSCADQSFGFAAACQVVVLAAIDADVFEHLVLRAPVDEVRVRDRHPFDLRAALGKKDQPLGFRVWQRLSSTELTTLKIAVFAPMPRVSASTATTVKPILPQHPHA